jgi:hypothetical protein
VQLLECAEPLEPHLGPRSGTSPIGADRRAVGISSRARPTRAVTAICLMLHVDEDAFEARDAGR